MKMRGESYIPLVTITVQELDEGGYFIIEDNGIGMTEEIIVNYFLKAGSSFRNSEIWKNNFMDEENKATIQRSGRFGVGVFAGFLIGKEMEVITRNIDSNIAFEFKVKMDQQQIEVIKTQTVIGTVIKIKLTKELFND